MALQAYIDDSRQGDWFVLAGHIATAEAWSALSREWERLLRTHGTLAPNGVYHFKMTEMAMNPERMARVPAFYRLIEEHVICSVSVSFRRSDLERARSRIYVPGYSSIGWGILENPYRMAFRVLMDMFHGHRDKRVQVGVPLTEKTDFYFDNQSEKVDILTTWEQYLSMRGHMKDRFGATPRFEDDKDFLPLQAADLWAWWIGRWNLAGKGDALEDPPFGAWSAERKDHGKISITASENEMVDDLMKVVRRLLPPGHPVYDVSMTWQ